MPIFELTRKIGSGSFGEIYAAKDEELRNFAVKFERGNARHPQLFSEYKLYKILQGGKGIPQVYHFSVIGDYNVMVMELLGHSLEELFCKCGRKFSLKTTLLLGVHMLRRLEFFHSKMFVHRDLKPDNFVMGLGENTLNMFIIDFGLAKRYWNPKTNEHIPFVKHSSLSGTARYASVNAIQGYEQSRRDDLESIFYVLLYFVKGSLPWQGVIEEDRLKKLKIIADMKQQISAEKLCHNLPTEFADIYLYIRNLKFDQTPDYSFIRSKLRVVFAREGFVDDGVYDWITMKKRTSSANPHGTPKKKIVKDSSPALENQTNVNVVSNSLEQLEKLQTDTQAETKTIKQPSTTLHFPPLALQQAPSKNGLLQKKTGSLDRLCSSGDDSFTKPLKHGYSSTPTLNTLSTEKDDDKNLKRMFRDNCMKTGLSMTENENNKFPQFTSSKRESFEKTRELQSISTTKNPQTVLIPSSSFVSQFSPELKLVRGLSCTDETSIRVSIGNSPQRKTLKPLKGRQRQRTESFSEEKNFLSTK